MTTIMTLHPSQSIVDVRTEGQKVQGDSSPYNLLKAKTCRGGLPLYTF